jgi:hypothetical protein
MADQARIASIDALGAFRSDLLRYTDKSRAALGDMTGEVRRMRSWLDSDRSTHWLRELKRRTKHLEQAENELYSANLTSPKASNAVQKMAVARAQRAVEEAELKLRVIRKWRQQFDNRTGALLRLLEPMQHQVTNSLPKAAHLLSEVIKALQDYAATGQRATAPPQPPPEPEP